MAVFINTKQHQKLNAIVLAYRNGQKKDAAEKVRRLTKRELVNLILGQHQLPDGFVGDREGEYEFHSFIDRALDGYGE